MGWAVHCEANGKYMECTLIELIRPSHLNCKVQFWTDRREISTKSGAIIVTININATRSGRVINYWQRRCKLWKHAMTGTLLWVDLWMKAISLLCKHDNGCTSCHKRLGTRQSITGTDVARWRVKWQEEVRKITLTKKRCSLGIDMIASANN